jgi:hypothetical protein
MSLSHYLDETGLDLDDVYLGGKSWSGPLLRCGLAGSTRRTEGGVPPCLRSAIHIAADASRRGRASFDPCTAAGSENDYRSASGVF